MESTGLLSPSAEDLPMLFEVARILGRYPDLSEAFEPLVRELESSSLLRDGAVAIVVDGRDHRVLLPSSLPFAIAGRRVTMGEGPLGMALESGHLVDGQDEAGSWLALPVASGASVESLLAFRFDQISKTRARALLEGIAILVGEAIRLRQGLNARNEALNGLPRGKEGDGELLGAFGAGIAAAQGPALAGDSHGLLGRSAAMAELRGLIAQVGPTDATVLVTGESGTGKELAARALHESSARASGPFVAVNCAALPESLIESELFGHEKGAFTGADIRRKGRFELASGGTLFFDEIGELGLGVQAKLLRVIQERRFERVGGGESIRADVRIVAATNRELEKEVAEGRFREDLFWRLNVFPLRMPPLRERGGDIVLIADHFAETIGARLGKPILRISTPALDLLTSYHWPGNVRELENAIERAVVLSSDGVIHAWHLPPSLQSAASTGTAPTSTLDATLARIERELVIEALKLSDGIAAKAAQSLGITERRFGLAMHKYNISWKRFRTKK
ncbi:MAG TPA: sigma 54-interacting transcriptional regulator [Rectinemataceae bacterium]|nr:sigma 54-interacting transcriptional regulator [Rectinemataceae bacterium]